MAFIPANIGGGDSGLDLSSANVTATMGTGSAVTAAGEFATGVSASENFRYVAFCFNPSSSGTKYKAIGVIDMDNTSGYIYGRDNNVTTSLRIVNNAVSSYFSKTSSGSNWVYKVKNPLSTGAQCTMLLFN